MLSEKRNKVLSPIEIELTLDTKFEDVKGSVAYLQKPGPLSVALTACCQIEGFLGYDGEKMNHQFSRPHRILFTRVDKGLPMKTIKSAINNQIVSLEKVISGHKKSLLDFQCKLATLESANEGGKNDSVIRDLNGFIKNSEIQINSEEYRVNVLKKTKELNPSNEFNYQVSVLSPLSLQYRTFPFKPDDLKIFRSYVENNLLTHSYNAIFQNIGYIKWELLPQELIIRDGFVARPEGSYTKGVLGSLRKAIISFNSWCTMCGLSVVRQSDSEKPVFSLGVINNNTRSLKAAIKKLAERLASVGQRVEYSFSEEAGLVSPPISPSVRSFEVPEVDIEKITKPVIGTLNLKDRSPDVNDMAYMCQKVKFHTFKPEGLKRPTNLIFDKTDDYGIKFAHLADLSQVEPKFIEMFQQFDTQAVKLESEEKLFFPLDFTYRSIRSIYMGQGTVVYFGEIAETFEDSVHFESAKLYARHINPRSFLSVASTSKVPLKKEIPPVKEEEKVIPKGKKLPERKEKKTKPRVVIPDSKDQILPEVKSNQKQRQKGASRVEFFGISPDAITRLSQILNLKNDRLPNWVISGYGKYGSLFEKDLKSGKVSKDTFSVWSSSQVKKTATDQAQVEILWSKIKEKFKGIPLVSNPSTPQERSFANELARLKKKFPDWKNKPKLRLKKPRDNNVTIPMDYSKMGRPNPTFNPMMNMSAYPPQSSGFYIDPAFLAQMKQFSDMVKSMSNMFIK